MRTIATDENNDIYLLPNGELAIAVDSMGDPQAVANDCRSAMQAILGEMIYAADEGMPYFQTAWDNKNPLQFEAAARQVILAVAGVTRVTAFTVTQVDDVLGYVATIMTIYGETQING